MMMMMIRTNNKTCWMWNYIIRMTQA